MGSTLKIDKNKLSGSKPGVDDYFKSMFGANQNDIQHIEIYKLVPFEGQPFKPYSDDKLQDLADDIAENGILSPLIVRPHENAYQILAGHNRANAALLAGLDMVPCIVKDVDDDVAESIMLNTNLNQREKLLPSEKAFAYKMRLAGMKRQGQRTDLTSAQVGRKSDGKESREILASQIGESKNQVSRYIRLTELVQELLDMVDEETISFGAGVSLSYLKKDDQRAVLTFMNRHKLETISLVQAENIRSLGDFSDEWLSEVFDVKCAGQKKPEKQQQKTVNFKIPAELLGDNDISKIKADGELYVRIAETIKQYYREKNA